MKVWDPTLKPQSVMWSLSSFSDMAVLHANWGKKGSDYTLIICLRHTYIYIYICIHSHNICALNIYTHACIRIHAHNHIYIYIVQIKFCLCALNTCTHRQTHTPAYARTHTHDHASILQIKFCLGTTEQSNLDFWNKSSNFSQIAKIHACMITLLWDQLLYADGFKIWNKAPYRFDLWRYVCLMRSFLLFASLWICQLHTHLPVQVSCRQGLHHRCVPVSGAWPPQLYGFPPKGLYKHHRFVSVDYLAALLILSCSSGYNCTGGLGVKHQVTFLQSAV